MWNKDLQSNCFSALIKRVEEMFENFEGVKEMKMSFQCDHNLWSFCMLSSKGCMKHISLWLINMTGSCILDISAADVAVWQWNNESTVLRTKEPKAVVMNVRVKTRRTNSSERSSKREMMAKVEKFNIYIRGALQLINIFIMTNQTFIENNNSSLCWPHIRG